MAKENIEIVRNVYERWRSGDSVVARLCQRGVGEESGAATELRYFHVWSFRGERVIRLECLRERGKAPAAAGLSEKAMSQERD
jgi:ketosteroid isomerase-like protein